MKRLGILLFLLLVLFPFKGQAETLQWDRNPEPDMKDYQVYACFVPSCVLLKSVTTLQAGNILQPAIGVVPSFQIAITGKEGEVGIVARDQSLNESALSVLPFDKSPPRAVGGARFLP